MTENVVTTTPETLVTDAARVMVDRKIGCLPVIEGQALIGILSESELSQLWRKEFCSVGGSTRRRIFFQEERG